MAARRYEISLRVLKNNSRGSAANEWNIFSTREERFHISKRPCNILCIIIINTNELSNHFTLIVFWCERCGLLCSHSNGDIFTREDNMLFSHVKIPSFCAKARLVFHWCLYNKLFLLSWRFHTLIQSPPDCPGELTALTILTRMG